MDKKVPYIAEDLQQLIIPIKACVTDPDNVRRHGEKNMKAIKASLKKFGQRKPIVVQEAPDGSYIVRAGNGTLVASQGLKREFIAAVKIKEDDKNATAYAIADNRTAELAEWDDWGLSEQLQDLNNNGFSLETLGFTEKEYDKIVKNMVGATEDNFESSKGALAVNQEYLIVIAVDEEEQTELYEEFLERGLNCKIM